MRMIKNVLISFICKDERDWCNGWEWAGKSGILKYCWCFGIQIEKTFLEGLWQYLSKILHVSPFDQAILFLGIYIVEILCKCAKMYLEGSW